MSYILDALNKAERERGLKHAPTPLIRHALPAGSSNRRWILAVVIVACAAATWFSLTYRSKDTRTAESARAGAEQNSAAVRTEAARDGDAASPSAAPSPVPPPEISVRTKAGLSNDPLLSPGFMTRVPATAASAPEGASARQAGGMEESAGAARRLSQAAQAEAVLRQDQAEPDEPPPSEDAPAQAQPNATDEGQAAKEATPASQGTQNEVLSLREAVDKMTISVLMYSETKAERRAYINGRKYVEGDYVDGRYFVESITLEGVVLTYEGERALLRSGSR